MAKKVVTGILDPFVSKFDASYKKTKDNFGEAKQEILDTIQRAIEGARTESTLMQYKSMLIDTKKKESWNELSWFIYQEYLKRHGDGVLH